MRALYLMFLTLVTAIQPKHIEMIRSEMAKQKTNDWVTIQNAIQRQQLAYTSSDLKHIYIDFDRFRNASNTLANVIKHEVAHTKGATHGDGSPYMQYAVRVDMFGNVIEDAYVMP